MIIQRIIADHKIRCALSNVGGVLFKLFTEPYMCVYPYYLTSLPAEQYSLCADRKRMHLKARQNERSAKDNLQSLLFSCSVMSVKAFLFCMDIEMTKNTLAHL